MTKQYEINVSVHHFVVVEADSIEEAEEYAMDQFSDDAGMWDEYWIDIVSEEEI